jgi:predicted metalloprotease
MKFGIGGFLLLAVLSLVFKKDFFALVGGGGALAPSADVSVGSGAPGGGAVPDPREEELTEFVVFVLNDAQATWQKLLPSAGTDYVDAKSSSSRTASTRRAATRALRPGRSTAPATRRSTSTSASTPS